MAYAEYQAYMKNELSEDDMEELLEDVEYWL